MAIAPFFLALVTLKQKIEMWEIMHRTDERQLRYPFAFSMDEVTFSNPVQGQEKGACQEDALGGTME